MTIKEKLQKLGYCISNNTDLSPAERDDDLDFVIDEMKNIIKYVSVVENMESQLPILRFRFEGEAYISRVENLDKTRRAAHETAIGAVSALNRLCKSYGLEPFYIGDEQNRYQVADFCGNVVNELFVERDRNPKRLIKERLEEFWRNNNDEQLLERE